MALRQYLGEGQGSDLGERGKNLLDKAHESKPGLEEGPEQKGTEPC